MRYILIGVVLSLVLLVPAIAQANYNKDVGEPCAVAWAGNTEFDLSHYIVEQGPSSGQTQQTQRANHTQLDCGSVGMSQAGTYWIRVLAVDDRGNVSEASSEIQLTVVAVTEPPVEPPIDPPNGANLYMCDIQVGTTEIVTLVCAKPQEPATSGVK